MYQQEAIENQRQTKALSGKPLQKKEFWHQRNKGTTMPESGQEIL
jgi:hypothetical protein